MARPVRQDLRRCAQSMLQLHGPNSQWNPRGTILLAIAAATFAGRALTLRPASGVLLWLVAAARGTWGGRSWHSGPAPIQDRPHGRQRDCAARRVQSACVPTKGHGAAADRGGD